MPKVLSLKSEKHKYGISALVHKDGTVAIYEPDGVSNAIFFTPEEWEKVSVFVLEQYKKLNSTT